MTATVEHLDGGGIRNAQNGSELRRRPGIPLYPLGQGRTGPFSSFGRSISSCISAAASAMTSLGRITAIRYASTSFR
jgi:hypothetical protein